MLFSVICQVSFLEIEPLANALPGWTLAAGFNLFVVVITSRLNGPRRVFGGSGEPRHDGGLTLGLIKKRLDHSVFSPAFNRNSKPFLKLNASQDPCNQLEMFFNSFLIHFHFKYKERKKRKNVCTPDIDPFGKLIVRWSDD